MAMVREKELTVERKNFGKYEQPFRSVLVASSTGSRRWEEEHKEIERRESDLSL